MEINAKDILSKKAKLKENLLEFDYCDDKYKAEALKAKSYDELMILNDAGVDNIHNPLIRFIERSLDSGEDFDFIWAIINAWCKGENEDEKYRAVQAALQTELDHYESIGHTERVDLFGLLINRCIGKLNPVQESTRNIFRRLMYSGRMSQYATLESSINIKIGVIANNINFNPSTVRDFMKVVREIETAKPSAIINDAVDILFDTTNLLFAIDVEVGRDMERMVADVPVLLAKKLHSIQETNNKPIGLLKAFSLALVSEKKRIYDELKAGEPKKYDLYNAYISSLDRAIKILKAPIVIHESTVHGLEDEEIYSEGVMDDYSGGLDEFSLDFMDEDEEETLEAFLVRLENYIDSKNGPNTILVEGKKFSKVNHAIHKASKKLQGKGGSKAGSKMSQSLKMIVDDVTRTVDKLMEMDKQQRHDMLFKGGMKAKLLRLFRRIVTTLAANVALGLVFPPGALAFVATSILSVIVGVVLTDHIEKKDKKMIIKDLELELKIVNEKIDDAKSDSDRKAKYELMRIQNKLERQLERLNFNIDSGA